MAFNKGKMISANVSPILEAMYQLFTGDCIHKHILYRTQNETIYIEACHDKAAMTTTNIYYQVWNLYYGWLS